MFRNAEENLQNSTETTYENNLRLLGELMFQSHARYVACGLCEPGTNRLVELVGENAGKIFSERKLPAAEMKARWQFWLDGAAKVMRQ